MTRTPDSDQGTGGEKWSDSECIFKEQQDQDQIRVVCMREINRDESKVFGKMALLSAEMGKTVRKQIEVSAAWFWKVTFKRLNVC